MNFSCPAFFRRAYVYLLLALYPAGLLCQAQEERQAATGGPAAWLATGWQDFLIFADDGLAYYTAPLQWESAEWLGFGGLVGGHVLLVSAADEDVRRFWLRNQSSGAVDDVMEHSAVYGDVFIGTIVAGGVYLTGLFAENEDIRIAGRMLSETLIYSGLLTMGLRFTLGRSRPFLNDPASNFTWLTDEHDYQAFPSGHTTVAFGFSVVVAGIFEEDWLSGALYGAAALMAVSRLYEDSHWLSDITSGAVIGYTAGKFVLQRERMRQGLAPQDAERYSFMPTVNGIRFVYRL